MFAISPDEPAGEANNMDIMPARTAPDGQIDRATLSMMLEGIVALRRHRRYSHRRDDCPVKV